MQLKRYATSSPFSQATICLAFLERLLERVALRVRVGDAVRLRVRVLVGDTLAAR